MEQRRLLLVHAHPDDESINNGATMAKYVAEGHGVTLVTCTLGEEGEILVPDLAHLAADQEDGLGLHRIDELAEAMKALGVTDHRFLGGPGRWRDSGMMGLPENDAPRAFWRADLDEATRELVAIVREVRPQVLVTYDENGGYGHPDHVRAHEITVAAVERVPEVQRLFYAVQSRAAVTAGLARLAEVEELPFDLPSPDEVASVDDQLAKVTEAGGTVLTPRTAVGDMGFTGYFADTEGNVIGLWENVPPR